MLSCSHVSESAQALFPISVSLYSPLSLRGTVSEALFGFAT